MPTAESASSGGGTSSTASAIVAGTVTGHHLLHIDGYSYTKEKLPTGSCMKSRLFRVGDRPWRLEYYPNSIRSRGDADFISVFLNPGERFARPVKARAKFSLLDRAGRPVPSYTLTTDIHQYSTSGYGYDKFIKREFLEKSVHLKDDCFTIRCDVTVLKDLCTEDRRVPLLSVPPSDLHRHLGDLLAAKEGTDVTFQVAGETFSAHRSVLAARSPVFKVELFGPMKESTTSTVVKIDDMEAQVFGALLRFMYTDALPELEEQDEFVMAQHLLVAADRYNLERLKLICEEKLCNHVDRGSAAAILTLAEQHNCRCLKEVCFRFLDCPTTLNDVMATDGFEHLARSCPSVVKELIFRIADR